MITESVVWTAKCDITGVRVTSIKLGSDIGSPISDVIHFKRELEKLGWKFTMGADGEKILCPEFVKTLK